MNVVHEKIEFLKVTTPCFQSLNLYNFNFNSTSVNNSKQSSGFILYPNPAATEITVCKATGTPGNIDIFISDVLGNIVFQSEIHPACAGKSEMNLSGYAKGIYFVRIEDENKNIVNRKIIKE